ncbi:hypothetical protein Tco_0091942 [Tanacetum coccineum]
MWWWRGFGGGDGGVIRRVKESGGGDRIDPVTRRAFLVFAEKEPSEKFSGAPAQRIQPTLYDGSVIVKEHVVISVTDDKETLILQEESRSKMLDKQNNPLSIEKKVKISPIDYSKLNKIKEDFGKRFVTKKELDAEEAFWLKHSNHPFITPVASHTPVKVEAP